MLKSKTEGAEGKKHEEADRKYPKKQPVQVEESEQVSQPAIAVAHGTQLAVLFGCSCT